MNNKNTETVQVSICEDAEIIVNNTTFVFKQLNKKNITENNIDQNIKIDLNKIPNIKIGLKINFSTIHLDNTQPLCFNWNIWHTLN